MHKLVSIFSADGLPLSWLT